MTGMPSRLASTRPLPSSSLAPSFRSRTRAVASRRGNAVMNGAPSIAMLSACSRAPSNTASLARFSKSTIRTGSGARAAGGAGRGGGGAPHPRDDDGEGGGPRGRRGGWGGAGGRQPPGRGDEDGADRDDGREAGP